MKIKLHNKPRGDFALLIAVTLVAIFGCVMIYSASSYVGEVQYGDSFYFVKKQIVGVVLGVVAMIGTCLFSYKKLQ